MRDPAELNMRDSQGNAIRRPPPSGRIISAFEQAYGVSLPKDYVTFLNKVNGGEPVLADVGDTGEAVEVFFHLRDDNLDPGYGLFQEMAEMGEFLGPGVVPFGEDAFGNKFVFELTIDPAPVGLYLFDGDCSVKFLAPSFGEFLDMLVEPCQEDL